MAAFLPYLYISISLIPGTLKDLELKWFLAGGFEKGLMYGIDNENEPDSRM